MNDTLQPTSVVLILIVLSAIIICLILAWTRGDTAQKGGIPWSGPHHASYEMSNGHMYYLYPVDSTTLYVYDGDASAGRYFTAYSGNDGPFIHSDDQGFRWVLQWHGDTISVERVPNNTGLQPDYYLIGNKIPNVYKTRAYEGTYVLTDRNSGGPAFESQTPPGFLGYVSVQPTGRDIWVALARKPYDLKNAPVLYQYELDNGYDARTYSAILPTGQISKIIFYDAVNFQMLNSMPDGSVKPINGTRI